MLVYRSVGSGIVFQGVLKLDARIALEIEFGSFAVPGSH